MSTWEVFVLTIVRFAFVLASQIQTERMGDIHHYAWRARFRNQTVYINPRDGERFGDWEPLQCAVRD
jgi:hypothetical protein